MSDATLNGAPLTVVLVHGAFADASSWNGVVDRLQAAGVQVRAPANPLRGISHDAAYIRAARKGRPVWAVVARGDKAARADVIRSQAERAEATITEVEGLARDHDLPP